MRAQFGIVVAMACAAAFGDAFEMERVNAGAREIVGKKGLLLYEEVPQPKGWWF